MIHGAWPAGWSGPIARDLLPLGADTEALRRALDRLVGLAGEWSSGAG